MRTKQYLGKMVMKGIEGCPPSVLNQALSCFHSPTWQRARRRGTREVQYIPHRDLLAAASEYGHPAVASGGRCQCNQLRRGESFQPGCKSPFTKLGERHVVLDKKRDLYVASCALSSFSLPRELIPGLPCTLNRSFLHF